MENKINPNPDAAEDVGKHYSGGVQAFMKAGHWMFVLLVTLIFALLVYFFTLGGYFAVSPQESVIVLRFGKYVGTYTSDWHWFLPDPVTSKVIIPTNPQTLQLNFNAGIDPRQLPPPGENGELPGLQPKRDRYLLTADKNIIHVNWSVRYQINDPKLYFETLRVPANPAGPDDVIMENGVEIGRRGPHTLLARMLDNAVIVTTAQWNVDDILYAKQMEYRDAVEKCYRQMVEDMHIGVTVEEVRINGKVMPPAVTQAYFDALTAARAERGTMEEKAREYEVTTRTQASEESERIKAQAENYKKMVVANAEAEALYFESFLAEYKKNPDTALMSRYNMVLGEVLSGIDRKYVFGTDNGAKLRLKLSEELPKPKTGTEPEKAAKEGK